MKVLLAFFPIDDMGGIINHNEQLCAGLQELGHEVHTRLFLPREDIPRNGVAGGRGTTGHCGLELDQRRGYSWPRSTCVPYRGRAKKEAIEVLSGFDLIIWQVAVPTQRKENEGNLDWLDLYQVPVKQIAVIHDGNFLGSYPWLYYVRSKLTGLACVHHCALNSAKNIECPSAFIPNPQDIREDPDIGFSAWRRRTPGFLSLQTFKAWKHVPELVAAVPHIHKNAKMLLAGKGIDYYYLTSKDKCKWPGIWDAAIDHGMEYLDVITNHERNVILRDVTCLVDPSWSKKYAQIGGHFNRVVVDAIKLGALPVVRPLGISTNSEGRGELFVAGANCYAVPQHATSEEYGAVVTEACYLEHGKYAQIMREAINLLPMFKRKTVAQQYIELATGELETQYGINSQQVIQDAAKAVTNFFRGK